MTFGKIKSIIENDLLESYKNEKEFKQSLKEFRQNVLNNKNMSKRSIKSKKYSNVESNATV